jgi:hypothetical protein
MSSIRPVLLVLFCLSREFYFRCFVHTDGLLCCVNPDGFLCCFVYQDSFTGIFVVHPGISMVLYMLSN